MSVLFQSVSDHYHLIQNYSSTFKVLCEYEGWPHAIFHLTAPFLACLPLTENARYTQFASIPYTYWSQVLANGYTFDKGEVIRKKFLFLLDK